MWELRAVHYTNIITCITTDNSLESRMHMRSPVVTMVICCLQYSSCLQRTMRLMQCTKNNQTWKINQSPLHAYLTKCDIWSLETPKNCTPWNVSGFHEDLPPTSKHAPFTYNPPDKIGVILLLRRDKHASSLYSEHPPHYYYESLLFINVYNYDRFDIHVILNDCVAKTMHHQTARGAHDDPPQQTVQCSTSISFSAFSQNRWQSNNLCSLYHICRILSVWTSVFSEYLYEQLTHWKKFASSIQQFNRLQNVTCQNCGKVIIPFSFLMPCTSLCSFERIVNEFSWVTTHTYSQMKPFNLSLPCSTILL